MGALPKLVVTEKLDVSGHTKIDLGCGNNKREGFTGVDRIQFGATEVVLDFGKDPWPWADGQIEEAHSSHSLEHLNQIERIHFANELCRVLKVGGKCQIITPHWCAARAYGDPTHQWPPVSEWLYLYWNKVWRMQNAPHSDGEHWDKGYTCDFDFTSGNGLHPDLLVRAQDYQQWAMQFLKEAVTDLHVTVTKR